MSTYFLHDGSNQKGPFTLEELIQQGIDKNTNVWKEGSPDWVKAGELDDLKTHFMSTPPPLKAPSPTTYSLPPEPVKKSKSTLLYIIGIVILVAAGFALWKQNNANNNSDSLFNGSSDYSTPQREKTPEELKEELASKERNNPGVYLSVKGRYRKNLIGETVIEGEITNNATVAVFKDIKFVAEFLAPSETSLGKEFFTKYEILRPGKQISFKVKTFAPKQTETLSLGIAEATPVE